MPHSYVKGIEDIIFGVDANSMCFCSMYYDIQYKNVGGSKLSKQLLTFSMCRGPAATSSSAWIPLLYDTFVFLLTLYCVWPKNAPFDPSVLKKRLFEDGLIYYRCRGPACATSGMVINGSCTALYSQSLSH